MIPAWNELQDGRMSTVVRWTIAAMSPVLVDAAVAQTSEPSLAITQRRYDIASGTLTEALQQFTRQSGAAIAIGDARIDGVATPGVRGNYTATEALAVLLSGTGFVARRDGERFTLTPA